MNDWGGGKLWKIVVHAVLYVPLAVCLFLIAVLVRFLVPILNRNMCVGIGPEPIISNRSLKKAMLLYGWKAETFVSHTYYITSDFDYTCVNPGVPLVFRSYWLFIRSLFKYQILYHYFNGSSLSWTPHATLQAALYRIAKIRTVVMAYGADVQDLSRSPNLLFKHAVSVDYPGLQKRVHAKIKTQISYWTAHADHIVAGCDWVDYIPRWDTLVTDHFAVDLAELQFSAVEFDDDTLRVLHAPNHRAIKGTDAIVQAVSELVGDGFKIELELLQKASNREVLAKIAKSHVVIDQLLIGWYGFFAVEAMALGRPVISYVDRRYLRLFESAGLRPYESVPVINASSDSIKTVLLSLVADTSSLPRLGLLSRQYVERFHSICSLGKVLDKINGDIR